MSVSVMKDYNLNLIELHVSHTLGSRPPSLRPSWTHVRVVGRDHEQYETASLDYPLAMATREYQDEISKIDITLNSIEQVLNLPKLIQSAA